MMQQKKDLNYDDLIYDVDEVVGTDVKITPDYLIMQAALKAQNCLLNPDVRSGHNSYIVMVAHAEALCRAAKLAPADYDEQLSAAAKKIEETSEGKDDFTRRILLSHKKLEILMENVFSYKVSTAPLKG